MARLGWLGPAIVGAGLVIGGVGAWYIAHAAPVAGDALDAVELDGGEIVVRAESGGDRAFLELRDRDGLRWQALIPHYAGAPGRSGIAWGHNVVTVRVERGGEEEVWALGMVDSVKIASLRLAPEHEPIPAQHDEPLTLTDHDRSYEIVAGSGWHQVIALDLATGKGVWKQEVGAERIAAARLEDGEIVLERGSRATRLRLADGTVAK